MHTDTATLIDDLPRSYEMYTPAGDAAVYRAVRGAAKQLVPDARGRIVSRDKLAETLTARLRQVSTRHPEVIDTAVGECVYAAIEPLMEAAGLDTGGFCLG